MNTSQFPFASYLLTIILAASGATAAPPSFALLRSLFDPSTNARVGMEQGESVAVDGNIAVIGAPTDDESGVVKVYDATTGAVLHTLLNPTHPASDVFGRSVSISGTRLVVGAPEIGDDSGGVYVYDLASATPTVPVLTLYNPIGDEEDDRFGISVSISGTRVVVGTVVAGRAHVYDLSGATPTQPVAVLFDPRPSVQNSFGQAVAISGTWVVVGASQDDTGAVDAGSAYVYDLVSATPGLPVATFNNPSPDSQDFFGYSVAIFGTRVAVGVPASSFIAPLEGSAYIYDLASATPTVPVATLNDPNPAEGDSFGGAVSISSTRVVVGAFGDNTGAVDAGRAYVYDLVSATPTLPIATLNNPDPADQDLFGRAVAVASTRVVVGAPGDSTRAYAAGSAYLYDIASPTPTVPVAALNDPSPATSDWFGYSVAVSGRWVVIGALGDDTGAGEGSVYVYDLSGTTATVPVATLTNSSPDAPGSRFGYSVSISGARLVVGAPASFFALREGKAYIYDLAGATPTVPVLTLSSPTYDEFGFSVAISGTRVAVGAVRDTTGGNAVGKVYVFDLADSSPTAPVATLNNPSPADFDVFGASVAISGTRVTVGAPGDRTGANNTGSAYVYDLATATPTVPVATLNNPSPAANDSFGSSVAISGTRVTVGASGDNAGAGSAYVFDLASATPTVPVATLNNPSPAPFDHFGYAVAIAGTRAVVGAISGDSVYVYDLASATPTVPVATLNNPNPGVFDAFGFSVAVDGATVVAGAPYVDTIAADRGATYIFVAHVISGSEAVDRLIQLVETTDLDGRNKRPLIATLEAARASFDGGNFGSAVSQLEAFQNKVRAQILPRNPTAAAAFIAAAQAFINEHDDNEGKDKRHGHGHGHGNGKIKHGHDH